jgi:hypothetical protein
MNIAVQYDPASPSTVSTPSLHQGLRYSHHIFVTGRLVWVDRTARTDPVAPATTSQAAQHKTATHTSTDGLPLHSYQGLLKHLATLTRNDLQYGTGGPVIPTLAEPTPVQRRVFQLIGAPIPTTLT